MKLIWDTETTGLPRWGHPDTDARQPNLVQLALLLLDDNDTERAAISVIIRPDGWDIPAEVSAIHGITTAIATAHGIPERTAVTLFMDLVRLPNVVVAAHNEQFDWRIMRFAMLREGVHPATIERLEACNRVCTMRMADQLMRLPPTDKMKAAGFSKSKPPSLTECMAHFFGEPHDNAHDAMADVRACARIWSAMTALEQAA